MVEVKHRGERISNKEIVSHQPNTDNSIYPEFQWQNNVNIQQRPVKVSQLYFSCFFLLNQSRP